MSCVLSVGAIRIASGFLAMTASSTGTCSDTLNSGAPWKIRSAPTAFAAASAPLCMVM